MVRLKYLYVGKMRGILNVLDSTDITTGCGSRTGGMSRAMEVV